MARSCPRRESLRADHRTWPRGRRQRPENALQRLGGGKSSAGLLQEEWQRLCSSRSLVATREAELQRKYKPGTGGGGCRLRAGSEHVPLEASETHRRCAARDRPLRRRPAAPPPRPTRMRAWAAGGQRAAVRRRASCPPLPPRPPSSAGATQEPGHGLLLKEKRRRARKVGPVPPPLSRPRSAAAQAPWEAGKAGPGGRSRRPRDGLCGALYALSAAARDRVGRAPAPGPQDAPCS